MLKTLKTILLSVKLTRRYNNLQGDFSEDLITLQRMLTKPQSELLLKKYRTFFLIFNTTTDITITIHLKNRSKVWKKQQKWGENKFQFQF